MLTLSLRGWRRIAVIATEGTVKGGAYARAIELLMGDAKIVQQPCQVFVALAEEGWTRNPATLAAVAHYLRPIFEGPSAPDTLVLGCTHFPVLAAAIKEVVGADVALVDSAETTASAVAEALAGARLDSAAVSASGRPVPRSSAAVASARNSRWREIANWSSIAAIGAMRMAAIVPMNPSGLSSSSPPKSHWNWRKFAIAEIAAPIIAAIVVTSTSRLRMCESSWAITPRTCSRGMSATRPSVTATAECCGLRPVANALGCCDGMT